MSVFGFEIAAISDPQGRAFVTPMRRCGALKTMVEFGPDTAVNFRSDSRGCFPIRFLGSFSVPTDPSRIRSSFLVSVRSCRPGFGLVVVVVYVCVCVCAYVRACVLCAYACARQCVIKCVCG